MELFSVQLIQKENAIYDIIEVRELQQQSTFREKANTFSLVIVAGFPKINGGPKENGSGSTLLLTSEIIKTEVSYVI